MVRVFSFFEAISWKSKQMYPYESKHSFLRPPFGLKDTLIKANPPA